MYRELFMLRLFSWPRFLKTLFVLVFSNIHDMMLNLGFSLAERRKHLKYVSLCGLNVNIGHLSLFEWNW